MTNDLTNLELPITLSPEQRLKALLRNHDAWFRFQIDVIHRKYPELFSRNSSE